MRIRMFVKVIAGLAMVLALAAPAAAQGTTGNSGVLFGVGVSFLNAEVVDDDSDTMTGFSLDFRKNVYSTASVDIGVVGDFGWHRKGFGVEEVGGDVDFTVMSFMGGVRFTASQMDRVAPFGQFLVGVARGSFSGDFSCDDFEDACPTDPAIGFGGGVDVRLTDRVNLRGQLDFFRVFTEEEGTNAIRFLIGISTLLGR